MIREGLLYSVLSDYHLVCIMILIIMIPPKYALLVWMSVCLFVSNKRQNGPKFGVGPHMTLWKVYRWSKFQNSIFIFNFENPQQNFYKIRKLFFDFVLHFIQKKFTIEIEDWSLYKNRFSFWVLCVHLWTIMKENWDI